MNIINNPFEEIKFKTMIFDFIYNIWFEKYSPYGLPSNWIYIINENKKSIKSPDDVVYKSLQDVVIHNPKFEKELFENQVNRFIHIFSIIINDDNLHIKTVNCLKLLLNEDNNVLSSSLSFEQMEIMLQNIIRYILSLIKDKIKKHDNNIV